MIAVQYRISLAWAGYLKFCFDDSWITLGVFHIPPENSVAQRRTSTFVKKKNMELFKGVREKLTKFEFEFVNKWVALTSGTLESKTKYKVCTKQMLLPQSVSLPHRKNCKAVHAWILFRKLLFQGSEYQYFSVKAINKNKENSHNHNECMPCRRVQKPCQPLNNITAQT